MDSNSRDTASPAVETEAVIGAGARARFQTTGCADMPIKFQSGFTNFTAQLLLGRVDPLAAFQLLLFRISRIAPENWLDRNSIWIVRFLRKFTTQE